MATYLFSDYEALSKTVNVQPRNAIYWETFSCPPTPQDTPPTLLLRCLWQPTVCILPGSLSLCFVTQASRDGRLRQEVDLKSEITSAEWHSSSNPLSPSAACLGVTHKGLRLKLAEKSVILSFGLACGVLMIFLCPPLTLYSLCLSVSVLAKVLALQMK